MITGTIHNEYTQGLARVTVQVEPSLINKNALTQMLFPERGEAGTIDDFIKYRFREHGVTLPEEAVRGADPNRVNFGRPFDENLIYGQYYDERFDVNLQSAQHALWQEPIDQPWTPQRRILQILAEGREDMRERFKMMKEKLVSDLIFNAKFPSRQAGGADQVFPMTKELLAIDGSTLTTDPFKCLTNAVSLIQAKGHTVRKLIMNPADALTLTASDKWQKSLDNRRILGNVLNPGQTDANGMAYVGTIIALGSGAIEVWTYDGQYTLEDGTTGYYVSKGKAILCNDTIGRMMYTGILVDDGSDAQAKAAGREHYVVCTYRDGVRVNTYIEGQCSPCPILDRVDHYGILTGIV